MRFLVVGLGSMGKRRIRNLLALGQKDILGFDPREDRQKEAHKKYRIEVVQNIEPDLYDVMIISTPPDWHYHYAKIALRQKKDAFMEANVMHSQEFLELQEQNSAQIIVPSATMLFFPFVKKLKEVLQYVGKILFLNYHVGQYLPDWHPWEDIRDFYVSKRATGACREIVPFELTWLTKVFGAMQVRSGVKTKLSDLPTDIDDIYTTTLQGDGFLCHLTVEVLSRPKASRYLTIVGEKGRIHFDGESIEVESVDLKKNLTIYPQQGYKEDGYINPEEPYIEEMAAFLEAVKRRDAKLFPNSLKEDVEILQMLYAIEELAGENDDLPR